MSFLPPPRPQPVLQDCAEGVTHWALGLEPCGDARPQVEQPLPPNRPAMLTLHAPRATARLRLNVKGFNMGDISPWQSFGQGRRIRPAVSLHPSLASPRHR